MSEPALKLAKLDGKPEIFHSIQGEGVSLGTPSVFVRSSLCNLHCRWCDTDYTWNWQGTPWPHENDSDPKYKKYNKEDYIITLPVSEVAKEIKKYPCRQIILTGGEPLLQETAWSALMQLLTASEESYRFEIETNGTLTPSDEFDTLVHQYNVSPKLSNSGNDEKLRLNSNALSFFEKSSKSYFKFVISSESDLAEIDQLIADFKIPHQKIILMPEGRDQETLEKRKLWLVDLCIRRGFRYSDRLHIQLWGSKRGV